jgi:hypothetical protein
MQKGRRKSYKQNLINKKVRGVIINALHLRAFIKNIIIMIAKIVIGILRQYRSCTKLII